MPDHSARMMDEFDCWAFRISKVLVGLLLLCLYLLAIAWWIEPAPDTRPQRREFTAAERRWVTERHKYHGIDVSIRENGEEYFYRDGKKCKL